MEAKFVSAYGRDLIYRYRGYEYMIHNYGWYGTGGPDESLKAQHKEEQKRIDSIIEDRNKKSNDMEDVFKVLDDCFEW